MVATYLNLHPNGGWRYQRHIPGDVRDLLGGRKVSVKYIPGMALREAEKRARLYASRDDELWHSLRRLSASERAEVVTQGGLLMVERRIPQLERDTALAERVHKWAATIDPREAASVADDVDWPTERMALWKSDMMERRDRETALIGQLERNRSIVLKVALEAFEYSFDGLLALWMKVREPKITRRHAASIALLKEIIGDVDYRRVTEDDIAKFRDRLAEKKVGRRSQEIHLSAVKGMFSAAVAERKRGTNPAQGINVLGKRPKRARRTFTGEQLRTILETAAATKFGGRRNVEVLWLLKLAIWTGCRINEAAQLRKRDVYVEAGVPIIHIREGHPQQSVKTGEARKVPLHPALAGFPAYASASETDFIFEAFPYDKDNGRAAYLIGRFGRFLREKCGITEQGLTLHVTRHAFIDAMRNAEVLEDRQRIITGHASGDVHGHYGQGAGLHKLAADLARVDPLAN